MTQTPSPSLIPTSTPSPTEPPEPGFTSAATPFLHSLSPQQMAGQRVILSYEGLTPPDALLTLISHGEAAGVIFFSGNISSASQLQEVIQKLELANASADNPVCAPLLYMIDQEGGSVRRLPGAPVLSEKQIGRSADPARAAAQAGTDAGNYLRSIGLNVNLAPVLDVYRTQGNFADQYGRSYSSVPQVVSSLGVNFIEAQQSAGVAATAKHFPGLGAAGTTQNTDARRVTLDVPVQSLRTIDELPYAAAINAGVKLVMVSWAVYPALDPTAPAGLSSIIVQGQLRDALGFKGVTITDALEARALEPYGTIAHRAELAAAAGMDLVLCSGGSVSEGVSAMNALRDGYAGGVLDRPAFEASVSRIIALRLSLGE
ncbi:MAG: beta-N-acetylhexosaminidase [Coriobacteriia bacterium]|nr:beta-N-acetylhexosaminidase [Coriobacteriia bacterium]